MNHSAHNIASKTLIFSAKTISKDPIDAEALTHLLKNIDALLDKADATEKKLLALFV